MMELYRFKSSSLRIYYLYRFKSSNLRIYYLYRFKSSNFRRLLLSYSFNFLLFNHFTCLFNQDVDSKFADASQQIPSAVATKDLTTTPRHSSIYAEFVSDPQSNLNQSENNNVPTTEHSALSTQDYIEAQKHAKYAVSALTYEDPKTAIENMKAAIAILTKYDRPF